MQFKLGLGEHVELANKILLVEDQLLIAMDAEAILNDHGYSDIETATNLDDARTLIANRNPSLVILDINLGGVTSFELAQELVSKNIPIAFASGYSDHDAKAHNLGHVPVISKPFGEEQLLCTVKSLLNQTA